MSLGDDDAYAREVARAMNAGLDLSRGVAITHFFSVTGYEPLSTRAALRAQGITDIVVDEETTGDGFWYIAAFTTLVLTPANATAARATMERIAQDTGVHYDGWQVSLKPDGTRHRSTDTAP